MRDCIAIHRRVLRRLCRASLNALNLPRPGHSIRNCTLDTLARTRRLQTILDLYTRDCLDVRPAQCRDKPCAAPLDVTPPTTLGLSHRQVHRTTLPPEGARAIRPVSFDERILNLRRQTFKEDFENRSTAVGLACPPKAGAAGALSTHAIPPRSWGGHVHASVCVYVAPLSLELGQVRRYAPLVRAPGRTWQGGVFAFCIL